MEKLGLEVKHEAPLQVRYAGRIIGEYCADLIVKDCVIVEVKAVKQLVSEHEAQLLNYLKATEIEIGILFNFGPKPELRRLAFSNSRK